MFGRALRLCVSASRLVAAAATISSAQAPVAPPAAIAAARAAMSDTVNGSALQVRLLTVGQGDLIFERYGHNMLWIIDTRTNESMVWNWGVFNFTEPGFLTRFLFGTGRYILRGDNAAAVLNQYASDNREVTSQELVLTPGQRAALDAFVRTNALPENMNYRYDYFLDNCSTRLRDALDIVLDGLLTRSLVQRSESDLTYRTETLRLNQHNTVLFMGLDLALGTPADRRLSPWEASFVPMRLRDEVQRVQVRGPDGTPVPLAGPPRVIIDAKREAEPQSIRSFRVRATIIIGGLLLSLTALGLSALARRGSRPARLTLVTLGAVLHVALGLLASLVVFMWGFTLHAFWAWNPHLLLLTPVSLAVAFLLPVARSRPRAQWFVERYHFTVAISAFVVSVVALIWVARGGGAAAEMLVTWAGTSWLVHLAFGLAYRLAGRGTPSGPADPAAGGMRIAA